MCLIFDKRFSTRQEARDAIHTPLIAKKDIPVYKVVYEITNSRWVGPYYSRFKYKEGINKSVFSFKTYKAFLVFDVVGWKVEVNRGLHSFIRKASAVSFSSWRTNAVIKRMIIPKGAKYFKNSEEYVSDTLILN